MYVGRGGGELGGGRELLGFGHAGIAAERREIDGDERDGASRGGGSERGGDERVGAHAGIAAFGELRGELCDVCARARDLERRLRALAQMRGRSPSRAARA